jgi:hypothetical protein
LSASVPKELILEFNERMEFKDAMDKDEQLIQL